MDTPVFTQDNLLFTVHTPLGKDKLLFKHLQGEASVECIIVVKIKYEPKFQKDLRKITDRSLLKKLKSIIEECKDASHIHMMINNLKKLNGYETFYRIASITRWLVILLATKQSLVVSAEETVLRLPRQAELGT